MTQYYSDKTVSCWRSVLIFFSLTVTPSIWRRDRPLRGSSGGPNGGGGSRDRGGRLMGWLPGLGTPPRNLGPLHLLPPLLPFAPHPSTSPHRLAFLVVAPEESADWWRETQASQLHLVIISRTPAASPCPLYLLSVLGPSLSRD